MGYHLVKVGGARRIDSEGGDDLGQVTAGLDHHGEEAYGRLVDTVDHRQPRIVGIRNLQRKPAKPGRATRLGAQPELLDTADLSRGRAVGG